MEQFNINKISSPRGLKKDQYDVVIIGAGIGGLVCGCYLAKAGLKVLIVEKNNKVGGYCTSFEREGFRFDAGVHYIGGAREGTVFREILESINVMEDLKFVRDEVTDTVILKEKNKIFRVFSELSRTIESLIENFPHEKKSIKSFFENIITADIKQVYARIKCFKNFESLLKYYFCDQDLITFFSIFLGNMGLPANLLDCLSGVVFFREFIFDGGYYPKGGIEEFPIALCQKFQEYKGELLLNTLVTKVRKITSGIEVCTNRDNLIRCRYLVNNGDIRNFCSNILQADSSTKNKLVSSILKLKPSLSAFTLHIGLDKRLSSMLEGDVFGLRNIWYTDTLSINKYYEALFYKKIDYSKNVFLISIPSLNDRSICRRNREVINVITGMPYKSVKYWKEHKRYMEDRIIQLLDKLFPSISTHIVIKISNAPNDFEKFTLNYRGAIHGWASLPSQTKPGLIPYRLAFDNIFIVGQWVPQLVGSGGINTVVYTGKRVAELILKQAENEHL